MNPLVRGAISGAIATGTMSLVIAGGKATGLVQMPPPKQISKQAGKLMGVDLSKLPEPAFRAVWLSAHLGYGVVCGSGYALIRGALPGGTAIRGLLFGGALWGVGYLGALPALGLYPPPEDDSSARTAVMIAAHAVYGTTLAAMESTLEPTE